MNKQVDGTDNVFIKNNLEDIFNRLQNLLVKKGDEYIGHRKDRFHNFNKTAMRNDELAEESLSGFQAKHITSIDDMIEDLSNNINHPIDKWQEKIEDTIIYYLLLEVMIKCRYKDKDKDKDKDKISININTPDIKEYFTTIDQDYVKSVKELNLPFSICRRYQYFSGDSEEIPEMTKINQTCTECRFYYNCRLEINNG